MERIGGLYIVESKQLFTIDDVDGFVIKPAALNAIRRTDNIDLHFGYVKRVWKPIQNIDAFGIVNEMIENKELIIENMGIHEQGAICHMLCRLTTKKLLVNGRDEIRAYLLISNHHDGETSIRFGFIPIRVSSMTSLSMATRNQQLNRIFRVRHSKQSQLRIEDISTTLQLMRVSFEETVDLYTSMDQVMCDVDVYTQYINDVFTLDGEDQSIHDVVRQYMPTQPTLWQLYNAVCNYINFNIGRYDQTQRIFRLWMGANNALTQKAIDYALRIVNR